MMQKWDFYLIEALLWERPSAYKDSMVFQVIWVTTRSNLNFINQIRGVLVCLLNTELQKHETFQWSP